MSSKYGFPGPDRDLKREEAAKRFANLVPQYEAVLADIANDFARINGYRMEYREDISNLSVRWTFYYYGLEKFTVSLVPDIDPLKITEPSFSGGIMLYIHNFRYLGRQEYANYEHLQDVLHIHTGLPVKTSDLTPPDPGL